MKTINFDKNSKFKILNIQFGAGFGVIYGIIAAAIYGILRVELSKRF
jgi:hypothetical protein